MSSFKIGIVKRADICLSGRTLYFAHFLSDTHHKAPHRMLKSNGQLHEDGHMEGPNFLTSAN